MDKNNATSQVLGDAKDRLKRQVHILAVDCGMKNNIIRPEIAFLQKDRENVGS